MKNRCPGSKPNRLGSWIIGMAVCWVLQACGGGGADSGPAVTHDSSMPIVEEAVSRGVDIAATAAETLAIVVRARATLAAGLGAQMEVRVDGRLIGAQIVSNVGAYQDYRFDLAAPVAAGAKVDVAFCERRGLARQRSPGGSQSRRRIDHRRDPDTERSERHPRHREWARQPTTATTRSLDARSSPGTPHCALSFPPSYRGPGGGSVTVRARASLADGVGVP